MTGVRSIDVDEHRPMTRLQERFGDRPWWLRDVPELLATAARSVDVSPGLNLLVAIDLEQRLLGTARLPVRTATYERRSRLAYDVMRPKLERLLPERPPGAPPVGSAFVVRAREDRVVPSIEDSEWERALLYACGAICCYAAGLVLVTPHGWRYADVAGRTPTLTDLGARRLRAV